MNTGFGKVISKERASIKEKSTNKKLGRNIILFFMDFLSCDF